MMLLSESWKFNLEPTTRIELVTSSLPRKRSTPELRRPKTNLYQQIKLYLALKTSKEIERETGFEPATFSLEGWRSTNWATPAFQKLIYFKLNFSCGESRIRTCEVKKQLIMNWVVSF